MGTTKTMTLADFLAAHSICRVWHCAFDEPTGATTNINTDTDCDEDYCDAESLLSIVTDWLSFQPESVEGAVTQDSDGEWRWEWSGGVDHRNCRGNSVYQLVVWAE